MWPASLPASLSRWPSGAIASTAGVFSAKRAPPGSSGSRTTPSSPSAPNAPTSAAPTTGRTQEAVPLPLPHLALRPRRQGRRRTRAAPTRPVRSQSPGHQAAPRRAPQVGGSHESAAGSGLNDWLDHRTGIQTAVRKFLYEDIPASSGWHQVFGSVAMFLFLVQAFTGALLAFNYAPDPRRRLQQPPLHPHRADRRTPHPRPASLGRQHDDRGRGAAHGAGLPLGRVQEAARSHLDDRRRPAPA